LNDNKLPKDNEYLVFYWFL